MYIGFEECEIIKGGCFFEQVEYRGLLCFFNNFVKVGKIVGGFFLVVLLNFYDFFEVFYGDF